MNPKPHAQVLVLSAALFPAVYVCHVPHTCVQELSLTLPILHAWGLACSSTGWHAKAEPLLRAALAATAAAPAPAPAALPPAFDVSGARSSLTAICKARLPGPNRAGSHGSMVSGSAAAGSPPQLRLFEQSATATASASSWEGEMPGGGSVPATPRPCSMLHARPCTAASLGMAGATTTSAPSQHDDIHDVIHDDSTVHEASSGGAAAFASCLPPGKDAATALPCGHEMGKSLSSSVHSDGGFVNIVQPSDNPAQCEGTLCAEAMRGKLQMLPSAQPPPNTGAPAHVLARLSHLLGLSLFMQGTGFPHLPSNKDAPYAARDGRHFVCVAERVPAGAIAPGNAAARRGQLREAVRCLSRAETLLNTLRTTGTGSNDDAGASVGTAAHGSHAAAAEAALCGGGMPRFASDGSTAGMASELQIAEEPSPVELAVADVADAQGRCQLELGNVAAAVRHHRVALRLRQRHAGDKDITVGHTHFHLGCALVQSGVRCCALVCFSAVIRGMWCLACTVARC